MAPAAPGLCQDETQTITVYTIEGEITSLDTVSGIIVVKWTQSYPSITYDEITLKVPDDLIITKGADTIGVEDLNQFDRVAVKYYKPEAFGIPQVTAMTVQSSD
ncbi:MAG: hypothetical protein Q7S07_03710 [Candidatus Omnitrophota bacterium]|nr:hypothetical protein [Candidatus Omnitrophota bacterium]